MTGRSLIIAIIWGPPPVRPNLGRMSRALRVFPCHNWVTSSRDKPHKEHQPSRVTGPRTWHRLQGGGCEMGRDVRTTRAAIGQLGPYSALIGCSDTGVKMSWMVVRWQHRADTTHCFLSCQCGVQTSRVAASRASFTPLTCNVVKTHIFPESEWI